MAWASDIFYLVAFIYLLNFNVLWKLVDYKNQSSEDENPQITEIRQKKTPHFCSLMKCALLTIGKRQDDI